MIQNHLTSQPLSKRLKELGVPQKSEFYWDEFYNRVGGGYYDKATITQSNVVMSTGDEGWNVVTSAFLSSELGEIMKKTSLEIHRFELADGTVVYRAGSNSETEAPTMAESMGLMLEYLILNGLIKL